MGFFASFFDSLFGRPEKMSARTANCESLQMAATEFQIRKMCLVICVNMIANAIARCEIRTFENNKEVRGFEYFIWNTRPNHAQNSTEFWHKAAAKLCTENELLIIHMVVMGNDEFFVADSWDEPENSPHKPRIYKNVQVGSMTYTKKEFLEEDVLHLTLNHLFVQPVLDQIYSSYTRLINAAMLHYEWDNGQHLKVHVSQMAQGGKTADGEDWATSYQKMLNAQVMPFLNSGRTILPEFEGYTFSSMGGNGDVESRDLRNMIDDIFDFTANGLQIPPVLAKGQVAGTEQAQGLFLGGCIDPICDQIEEEINRKRYGYEGWKKGNYVRMDSCSIQHFDLFENAPNVEKLVGSGAFTINDVLRAAGQPTINEPWADKHFLTKNIADIEETALPLEA